MNEARAAAGIDVERVDFIRVPVKDIEEAKHFYGDVLGLEPNPNSPGDDWIEYEVGDVTLAVMTPHTPSGNSILLYHRYAPYPDGTKP